MRLFFELFPNLLPCWRCGLHFEDLLKENPLTDEVLTNRHTLSRWLHMLHNKVNVRIGKPMMPYDAVARFYLEERNSGLPRTPLYPSDGSLWIAAVAAVAAAFGVGIGVVVQRARQK